MNFVKVDLETDIMGRLAAIDEELMLQIQDNMFTFDNLSMVDNRAIQVLMRNVESDLLMVALKGAAEETQDKFFENMSQRAKAMLLMIWKQKDQCGSLMNRHKKILCGLPGSCLILVS